MPNGSIIADVSSEGSSFRVTTSVSSRSDKDPSLEISAIILMLVQRNFVAAASTFCEVFDHVTMRNHTSGNKLITRSLQVAVTRCMQDAL